MTITRFGYVNETPASGDHVIGVRFFDETGGDGSVTVTPTSDYLLHSDQAGWNHVMIGGYLGHGLLNVSGAGAVATVLAPTAATGETRVTVGADAITGDGQIQVSNGGLFRMLGHLGAPTGTANLEIAPVFGDATVVADHGMISIAGFGQAEVVIGSQSGTGTLTLRNGGELAMGGNTQSSLTIGPDGTGLMEVLSGSVAHLGGAGLLQVGGIGMAGSFTSGTLRIDGPGSQVTGFATGWIGTNPASTTETPTSRGVLALSGGAVIGNVASTLSLGVMGELQGGTGTVLGALNMAGGTINMLDSANDVLTVTSGLRIDTGSNWIMLGGDTTGADVLHTNSMYVDRNSTLTLELMGREGYRFVTGDRMTLIELDYGPSMDLPGQVAARVHAGFNPEFGYVFQVVAGGSAPVRIEFEALSNMDGPGSATLDLTGRYMPGSMSSVSVFYDAGQSQFEFSGDYTAWASGLDGIIARGGPNIISLIDRADAMRIESGAGNDRIATGIGNDTILGGDGADTINGGSGDDFIFGGSTAADLRDVIFGANGNDNIDGGAGNDELNGGSGNDTVIGGLGTDTIIGNEGNDVLSGGGGSDLMYGNAGDDFFNGGFGYDRMNGGTGADSFYHLGIADHASDWIQDYNAAEGDVLVVGLAGAARSQFQVNRAFTAGAGDGAVQEAFIIYRPTGQILWALVDGGDDAHINIQIGGAVFDLLA